MTFPRGPSESGPMWYAQARLAVTVWGCKVSGACTNGETHWQILISRCMDRTAKFSVALIDQVLSMYNFDTTTDLTTWCDVGPHFRNYEVLGTLGTLVPQSLRLNTHVNFGPEAHFKTGVDGQFGLMDNTLNAVTMREEVHSMEQFHEAMVQGAALRATANPDGAKEFFHIFMPKPRHEIQTVSFKPSSLPVGIKDCHCWAFTIFDRRRKSFINTHNQVTGVLCKALMVDPTARMPKEFTVHATLQPKIVPTVTPIPAAAGSSTDLPGTIAAAIGGVVIVDPMDAITGDVVAVADALVDADVAVVGILESKIAANELNTFIGIDVKLHLGWKMSYKKLEPERETTDMVYTRLQRKFKKLSTFRQVGTFGSRRKKLSDIKNTSEKKVAHSKRVRAEVAKAEGLTPCKV
jgi:hypothetical protein